MRATLALLALLLVPAFTNADSYRIQADGDFATVHCYGLDGMTLAAHSSSIASCVWLDVGIYLRWSRVIEGAGCVNPDAIVFSEDGATIEIDLASNPDLHLYAYVLEPGGHVSHDGTRVTTGTISAHVDVSAATTAHSSFTREQEINYLWDKITTSVGRESYRAGTATVATSGELANSLPIENFFPPCVSRRGTTESMSINVYRGR